MKPRPRRGHLYLIRAVGLCGVYKIGRAKNLENRISGLRGGSPLPLKLVYSVKCSGDYVRAERILIEDFEDLHFRGEWFRIPSCRLQSVVDRMNVLAADSSL